MAISKIRNRGTTRSSIDKYTESPTTDDADTDDDQEQFIDEDDQKDLVESLQSEANIQSIFFQNVFGYGIGGFAIIFSLIFPLLCPDECANNNNNNNIDNNNNGAAATICWLHAVYSSLTHAWVMYPFVMKKTSQTTRREVSKIRTITNFIGIALQLLPTVLWLTTGFFIAAAQHDDHFFHLALIIGNVVTYIGAHLIYWDIQSTRNAIEELDSARYKHKAL
ncbi:MAG: hypothetical protein ACI8RD_002457 [Bacillariaceae sp.]|jgi:hypothetical protein